MGCDHPAGWPANGPDDLPGKHVGTVQGSLAAAHQGNVKANVQSCPNAVALFDALLGRQADAIVLNSMVSRYFETNDGKGNVKTVGNEFQKRDMAYRVQLNSTLWRQINGGLTATYDDGTYDAIRKKWFGID